MAITNGTNVTALEKPAVGIDTGPGWATAINNSIDAVDGHDHSSNKGIRITPAAINISADLEYNANSATELKNVIFDSSVTPATTAYSLYQSSGNLFWRDGSGTAIQMTITGTVNSGAGSITGMTGTQAAASYSDSAKTFHFFTDGGNGDYGKMSHADLLLYKFTDDNSADADYVTIAANAGVSGASGTIYVPSENGTFLTTNTSYATSAINVATSASNYPINLKPHGTGHVVIGNAGATGKLTSNGAYDLILDTNSGSSSSSIAITDAANGDIKFIPNGTGEIVIGSGAASGKITSSGAFDLVLDTNAGTNSGTITIVDSTNGNIDITPHGTGEVNISKVDIDGGTLAAITIDGNWTAASQTCANLGAVTTTGTIGLGGKLTAGSTEIEGSNFDITGGSIVGTTIGTSSHTTGKFTTCDATTDFTIGGLVVTDGNIADTGTLALVPVDGCTIALGSDSGDDFNIDGGKFVVEGNTGRVGVGTATPEKLVHIVGAADNANLEGLQLENTDWASTETGQAIAINMRLKQNSTMRDAGRITVGKDDDWDDAAATDSHMTFKTTLSNTLTEHMRIASSGDVDIPTGSLRASNVFSLKGGTTKDAPSSSYKIYVGTFLGTLLGNGATRTKTFRCSAAVMDVVFEIDIMIAPVDGNGTSGYSKWFCSGFLINDTFSVEAPQNIRYAYDGTYNVPVVMTATGSNNDITITVTNSTGAGVYFRNVIVKIITADDKTVDPQ